MRFSFEVEKDRKALCFARNSGQVYAGLSSDGEVLVSSNLSKWERFAQVGDESVASIISWANGLFMGTSPKGTIWAHNFSTGLMYEFVQTRDQCVSAFAIYNDKLYAGTSPQGIIYSFDGKVWREEYTAYGSGVGSMSVGNFLHVFLKSAETAIRYDGSSWSVVPLTLKASTLPSSSSPTISTLSSLQYSIVDKSMGWTVPPVALHNVFSSTVDGADTVFGGQGGSVYRHNGETASRVFQTDSGDVTSIVNIGTNMNLASIGGTVYLLDENKEVTP